VQGRQLERRLLEEAIAKGLAGSTNPAAQRDLAYQAIKYAYHQCKAKRLFTYAQALKILLISLDGGMSFRELRARYKTLAPDPYIKPDEKSDVLVISDRNPPSRTPTVVRGTVSEPEARVPPSSRDVSSFRALEDYI
jgi:hypothetical protein